MCRYALKFVNDRESAEDIVQECFVYLWDNWSRLAQIDSLKSYLFKSVKNRSLNFIKNKFIQSKEPLLSEYNLTISDQQPNALDLIEVKDLQLILEKALQDLPERCRTIFVLKRFDEKSNKEIASFLDISEKTVENQTTIALARMRNYVLRYWGNSGVILLNIILRSK